MVQQVVLFWEDIVSDDEWSVGESLRVRTVSLLGAGSFGRSVSNGVASLEVGLARLPSP